MATPEQMAEWAWVMGYSGVSLRGLRLPLIEAYTAAWLQTAVLPSRKMLRLERRSYGQ